MRPAVALVLLSISCAPKPAGQLRGAPTKIFPEDYPRVLETWTRSAKAYRGLDSQLFVTATYHSNELRRAFAVAFPDIYGHGGKITRRELVDLTGDVEQYHNFFMCMYTPDDQWNDLDQEDSIWRLTLIGSNGIATDPKEINEITPDANLRQVYKHIGRFDKCYLVRFGLTDLMNRIVVDESSESFTVTIASAVANAKLTWDLFPTRQAASPPARNISASPDSTTTLPQ